MSAPFFIRKSRVRHLIWGPVAGFVAMLILILMSNLFQIEPELIGDRQARTGLNLIFFVAVLISSGVFYVVLKISRRFATSSAEEVLAWDTRRPVLYLRTFEDDKQLNRDDPSADALKWGNPVLLIFRGIVGNIRFEERLLAVCEQVGPFIGLGHPTDRNEDYSGAARFSPFGDEWKDVVLDLMDKSAVIIIRATSREGEGMLWELDQIAVQKLAAKTVLYIEFDGADDDELRKLRYQKYAAMIQSRYGVRLPPFDPQKRFIYTPVGGEPWSGHTFNLSEALLNIGHPAEKDDALPLSKAVAPRASWLQSKAVTRIASAQPSTAKAIGLVVFGAVLGLILGLLYLWLETTLQDWSFDWVLDRALDGQTTNIDALLYWMLAITSVYFPIAILALCVGVGWFGGWLGQPGARPYLVASVLALLVFYHVAYGGFVWPYFFLTPDLELLEEVDMPVGIHWFGLFFAAMIDILVLLVVIILARIYALTVAERDIATSWQRGDVFLDKPIEIPRA